MAEEREVMQLQPVATFLRNGTLPFVLTKAKKKLACQLLVGDQFRQFRWTRPQVLAGALQLQTQRGGVRTMVRTCLFHTKGISDEILCGRSCGPNSSLIIFIFRSVSKKMSKKVNHQTYGGLG